MTSYNVKKSGRARVPLPSFGSFMRVILLSIRVLENRRRFVSYTNMHVILCNVKF